MSILNGASVSQLFARNFVPVGAFIVRVVAVFIVVISPAR